MKVACQADREPRDAEASEVRFRGRARLCLTLLGEVPPTAQEELRTLPGGACAGKDGPAKKAKELNLDAIHDIVHEMQQI